MKKNVLSLILLLSLCLQMLGFTAVATSEPSEPTETVVSTTPEESTEPTSSQYDDVQVGSNSGIDATGALVGPADADFDATALLLYEINSDTMVYSKNIDEMRYPASLTKVMTCLLALEHGTLTDQVTVSEEALADRDPSGSSSGLVVGEVLTLEQLLYCLMIASGNDAAPVIAEHIAGNESSFIDMMNQKAQELGCTGTRFANTHGLHDDGHYTTARDMAKIMLAAIEYDVFREIYSTARYELPATNMQDGRTLVTTNYLIGTTVTANYYDSRVIGGKTGFTTPAGRCVVCTAQKGDLYYLCVVMGSSTISTEEGNVYGSFLTASKILDLGFSDFTFAEVLSPLSPVAQVPVTDATESVVLIPSESVTTMLPDGYDEALLRTNCILNSPNGLSAPLESGQVVGKVEIYYDTICVGVTDLVTMTAVQKRAFASATVQAIEEVKESPWRVVVIILSILLVVLVLLLFFSAWVRYQNRKRRQMRRKRG